ncbi:threonine/serine exporter family protein [Enterococcus sp.]|uniref:threonine/serine exporter family protein n=1 Tax=Enterococcus sp. TaxID=35783 RepID=UPI000EC4536C|nr:threonine/serine exporter family protein [Enterococcus sp.]HCE12385.1 threonine/serine exporter [Enterococcus sp.]
MTILIHIAFSFVSTVAFGVLTNIPKRALIATGAAGMIGWLIYWGLQQQGYGIGSANFLAAFAVGCVSIFFSRRKKMPMIIFNIPSLVPLVPGGPAYKAVREFALGDNFVGLENLMIVVITAGAIAGGFMMTNVVEKSIMHWQMKRLFNK